MGRTSQTMRKVYMLDFGLARQYLNAKGEIRSPRSAAGFRGTVRYAAVSAHKNKEMGRQDDLWSLFYMLTEFLQGQLPWRKIKDKDEVGRMKEEVDLEVLLEDCPSELHQIAAHLRTLAYPDTPDYDYLESILNQVMAKNSMAWDDPFDWELGYENLTGRAKANGNTSARLKSHTTAVIRDQRYEEKNRALDTQAPITMGEDEDEQTNGQCPQIGHQMESSHEKNDKPKYKRHEFMKPKYGTVNMDVIDAVNARLAACDDEDKVDGDNDVEISINNRYNKKKLTPLNTTNTYAVADDLSANNPRTAHTILSKWHGSFDASCDDAGDAPLEEMPVERNETNRRSENPSRLIPFTRVSLLSPPRSDNISSTSPGLTSSSPVVNQMSPVVGMRNSVSSGLRISPSITSTKVAARVTAIPDTDDEKEQRRQRRLRRRSVETNVRAPDPTEPTPPQSPRNSVVQRSVVHSPAENIVKLRDNGMDEEFRIPLEDNNKPILFYKSVNLNLCSNISVKITPMECI
uniref:Protein kinase domain-containing protein n=1 Tax=Heterorhabditis bacteriophora TaxID=37862 RepID=A0A1I7XL65_HETBA